MGDKDYAFIQIKEVKEDDHLTNFGDGRDPELSYGTLFPSADSQKIGRTASEAIRKFASTMKHTLLQSDEFPFESDLVYIADNFAAQQNYAALPTSKDYRDFAEVLGGSARRLTSLIAENKDKCTQLDRGMRRQAQMPLLQTQQLRRPNLEDALAQLAALCFEMEQVQSPSGERPRDDLRLLTRKLDDIWKRMTGLYCPTSVDRGKVGENLEFYSEGPEFVLTIARVFDASIQPAQVATALRKRRRRKGRRQSSPPGDGGNSAQNSN